MTFSKEVTMTFSKEVTMTFSKLDGELKDLAKKLDSSSVDITTLNYEVVDILNLVMTRFRMMDEENTSLRNHIYEIYDNLGSLESDVRTLNKVEIDK